MMTTYDWAKEYMDYGYWPIPIVRSPERPPAIKWKEYQTIKPSYDEIKEWFQPERNIALVCGEASGLVIIDADDTQAELWVRKNCAYTPFQIKTNRGSHHYYRHPGGYIQSKTKAVPGYSVDRKADGGLATGLGSVHASGHIYCLPPECDMVSIHDLPLFDHEWFPRPIVRVQPQRKEYEGMDRFDRASRYISKIQGCGKGSRNQTAFSVAAAVVRDFALDYGSGYVLMSEWNAHNDPPLPERELEIIVKSALLNGRQPLGAKLA